MSIKKEVIEEIVRLRKEEKTIKDISEILKLSKSTIRKYCKKNNLEPKSNKLDEYKIKRIIELGKQGKSTTVIGKELGIDRSTVRNYFRKFNIEIKPNPVKDKLTEEEVEKRLKEKFPKFEYLGGYENCESQIKLRCKDCGYEFFRCASMLRKNENINCEICKYIKRENELIELINTKYYKFEYLGGYKNCESQIKLRCKDCGYEFTKIYEKIAYKDCENINCNRCTENDKKKKREKKDLYTKLFIELDKITIECKECGKKFETTKPNARFCSKECAKKFNNKTKEKRLYKNGTPDLSITLDKLIKRDNNICYICKSVCDKEDYKYDENDAFIIGRKYPTIEHVKPICAGGEHSWDNVKLACWECNTKKGTKY